MAKPYTSTSDIKAHVTTDWSHHNCKFQQGDFAEVSVQVLPREYVGVPKMDQCWTNRIRPGQSYVSEVKQRRVGRVGKVLAVSCTPDGKIRGQARNGYCERMYTKYYVQFRDGVILGYDSHHLNKAFELNA